MPKKRKVQFYCKKCGSTDVVRDATAKWDVKKQQWVICGIQDMAYCNDCGEDGNTILKEIK
jgi:predicted RNA-binding Zn-ribbon protein involved in translation (DUF1610 family)